MQSPQTLRVGCPLGTSEKNIELCEIICCWKATIVWGEEEVWWELIIVQSGVISCQPAKVRRLSRIVSDGV